MLLKSSGDGYSLLCSKNSLRGTVGTVTRKRSACCGKTLRMLTAPSPRWTAVGTFAANRQRGLSGLPKRCWPGKERVKAMQCGFPEEMFRAGK
jgi:hypothetical protein